MVVPKSDRYGVSSLSDRFPATLSACLAWVVVLLQYQYEASGDEAGVCRGEARL
jgi:hypothetical protein